MRVYPVLYFVSKRHFLHQGKNKPNMSSGLLFFLFTANLQAQWGVHKHIKGIPWRHKLPERNIEKNLTAFKKCKYCLSLKIWQPSTSSGISWIVRQPVLLKRIREKKHPIYKKICWWIQQKRRWKQTTCRETLAMVTGIYVMHINCIVKKKYYQFWKLKLGYVLFFTMLHLTALQRFIKLIETWHVIPAFFFFSVWYF